MFELASPWFLLFIPIPLIVWFFVPRQKTALPMALNVPFFKAMTSLIDHQNSSLTTQTLLILPALIWLSIVLALAGPRWVGEPQPITREGYNIMLALDLSASMEINDMVLHGRPASRLAVVKRAAEAFVKDRPGDRIGLILFGTRAYLQTPLTYDRHSVLMRIEDATAGLAGKTTSIGDAVGLAVKRLDKVPNKGRVIILLTDGANTSGVLAPLKASELAADEGIKMYTIGLGSEADPRALANDFLTLNASADLDEETLEQMAKVTGGQYFRATDTESLQSIYKKINQLETIKQEEASIRPQKEYYPWCVGVAIFLSFFWMAKRTGFFFGFNPFRSREERVLE